MKRVAFLFVVCLLLTGLAAAQAPVVGREGNLARLSEDQWRELAAKPEITTLSVDPFGIPDFVVGRLGRLPSVDVEGALMYLYGAEKMMRAAGFEEFEAVRVVEDELGQVHFRFQQYLNGLPVVGAELMLHAEIHSGEVRAINGRFIPHDEKLPRRPQLAAWTALDMAREQAGIVDAYYLDGAELTYVTGATGKPYLAWASTVYYETDEGEPRADRLFADAGTGDLVAQHGLIHDALYRKIYNANYKTTLPGTLMFVEGGSSTDTIAMNVYHNMGRTYNYFQARFNRDSYNNSGAQIVSSVHVGSNYVNAYWSPSQNQFAFGDGNGTTSGPLGNALDIVAHEFTHAVTTYSANLTYSNESGALNEAMSDIFAAGTESWFQNGPNANTWKCGEEVWTPNTPGDALRYMDNPTLDGACYDYYPERYTGTQDYGGVHWNCGIGNLAFYLLSQGGTHPRNKTTIQVPAITLARAEQIFYRALTVYMTASTNFQGARNATAQAATDLYGASYADAVHAAWSAVGVPGGPVQVATLTSGQTVSSLSAAKGGWLYYKIAVPSGQTSLTVQSTGGSGDADLYVRLGSLPTTSSYTGRSAGSTNAETVTISNPASGDWFIGLYAYAAFSGVSLQATHAGSTASFALALSPTSLSVAQGASGTATVTVTGSGGFNSAVSFSLSGLPSGASASFSPTSVTGSGNSTLTINGGTAATGTYNLTITGSGGGLTRTTGLTLTVTTGSGTSINERESNNTMGTANLLSVSNTTVTGYISSSTDVDFFHLSLPAGATLTVDLTVPSNRDYDLHVLNSSGTIVARGENGRGVAERVAVTNNGSIAATVYLKVFGYNRAYSTSSPYRLKAVW